MKNHYFLTLAILLFGCCLLHAIERNAAVSRSSCIEINWSEEKQTIDGFGISQAGWAKELFAFEQRDEVMDYLFGNNGLRLSILRGEIFPHYWENKEDKNFNLQDNLDLELTDADFTNKSDDLLRRGQLWLTLQAKNKYHVDKLLFSTWSAPTWMKDNGKVSQGKLRRACYQDFADYLAAFYLAYDSVGLAPYAISPSNEPGYAAPWNSSLWTADEMGEFIASYLGPTFEKKKIPARIVFGENPYWSVVFPPLSVVSSSDFTNTMIQNYPNILRFNLIASGHGYDPHVDTFPIPINKEDLETPIIPFALAEKNHLPVWVTEISATTPLDMSMNDGLQWAATFYNYLTQANVNAIVWWAGAMPAGNNESLILLNRNRKEYSITKRYDAFGNYSRYIVVGSKRIAARSNEEGLMVSAFKKDNEYVVVVVNSSANEINSSLSILGADAVKSLTRIVTDEHHRWAESEVKNTKKGLHILNIPAQSVTTFVGKIKK